jgi:hypothetical protein
VFLWSRILSSSRKSQFRAFSSGNLGFPDVVQSYQTEVLQSARQLQEVGVGRIGLEDFLGVESTLLQIGPRDNHIDERGLAERVDKKYLLAKVH